MRIYRLGDDGPEVLDIQQRLTTLGFAVDTAEWRRFGPSTEAGVRAFQAQRRLLVDGRVGPDTWGQLVEAGYRLGDRTLYLHAPPFRGDDVRTLQRKLNALGFDAGREDGAFGVATDLAVREFQRNVGDLVDGVVGLHTWETLDRMRPMDDAASRAVVREREQLREPRGPIRGRVIAIDTGDPNDPSAELLGAAARALATELEAMGALPALVGIGDDGSPAALAPSDRARAANALGADLLLCLHAAEERERGAGPACAYFGGDRTHSPIGKLLAELILAELTAVLGTSGRLHRLSTAMLRETRMPAVLIEPPVEGEGDPAAMAARIGRATANGVRQFFDDE